MKNILLLLPLVLFTSCLWPEVILPDPPQEEIVVDTCEALIEYTLPAFITLYNEYFNGLPDSIVWNYDDEQYPTLKELLLVKGYNTDSIQIFEEGASIAAVIRGTNDKTILKGHVWTRDAIGQKAFFTVNAQAFIFGGALTFEEYHQIAKDLKSVNVFNFRNCNWTQEQLETVATVILGECKQGRHDANFMFNVFPISDSLYCEFVTKWEIVRGQIEFCEPLPFVIPNRA